MKNYDSKLEKAIELYKNGMSLTKIQKEVGIERHRLGREFKKLDINIVQNNKIHKINESIFEQIDTEEKAYWLGFLYADGYVSKTGIELALKQSDYNHLVKFKKFLECDYDIKYHKSTNSYRICIHSKKIVNDLTNLGCMQAKSLILQFPTEKQVPTHLIHHFMRGYFDGDGSICRTNFSVLGTKEFLIEYESYILNYLQRNNPNKMLKKENINIIQYGGRIQVLKIFQFLYENATIYLERKYDKFNALLPSQDETDK